MNSETILKFKIMFKRQEAEILKAQTVLSEDQTVQTDELFDETDLTSVERDMNMQSRLKTRQALFLKKIKAALKRIEDGSFGVCDDCGEDIEVLRLQARPTTELCVSCKEEQEKAEWEFIDGHRRKSLGSRSDLRLA